MPAGPGQHMYHDSSLIQDYSHNSHDNTNGDESAASILQSVKEQEAQFEQLTRELEAERQSVANQLERCKLGSETASMSSISSTDESFHWRPPPPQQAHIEDESDAESKMSGSQLVDSCLRVLQERGLMNVGEDPLEHLGDSSAAPPRPPLSSEHYNYSPHSPSMNGPTSYYDRNNTGSPNPSLQSGNSVSRQPQPHKTVTTHITKVVTTRQVQRVQGSPAPGDNYQNYNYSPNPDSPYGRSPVPMQHSPAASHDPPTPTRFNSQPFHEPDLYDSYEGSYNPYPHGQYSPRYQDQPDRPGYQDEPPHMEEPYHSAPYGSHFDNIPPAENDYRVTPTMVQDRYRETPPVDGRYRETPPVDDPYHPVNENYNRQPGSDRDPYRDYEDDRYRDDTLPRDADPYRNEDDRYRNAPHMDYRDPNEDPYVRPKDSDYYRGMPHDGGPYPRPTRTPSPGGSDRMGPPGYMDRSPTNNNSHQKSPYDMDEPYRRYDDDMPYNRDYDPDMPPQVEGHRQDFEPDILRRSPSVDSQTRDNRWRDPDLPEVIEFLRHQSNAIKANAAAYLQHLTYMDDGVKAKTRALGGIPALVDLVNNEIPEVHRNACGALRNLSYGRANDDNKRAIKNEGGIPALVRLLRKSPDNDVRELVTGILWNLSSCADLKKNIIDDGLAVIVNNVIIPHSGWDRYVEDDKQNRDVYWPPVFRNATGILRNISSDAHYARSKLRECEGLVDSILYIVMAAIGKNDIDNKSVENCVCVLRNLSYACQEVEDPNYLKKRNMPKEPQRPGAESTGCFGGNKKKKEPFKIDQRNRSDSGYQSGTQFNSARSTGGPPQGMEKLWDPKVVDVYLPLLSDCSNPETLEAAAGAIQNLAACDWIHSVEIRAAVRKEKGLPIIVELLSLDADRVVCAAATALRNLALDTRNKELIGKYAMHQLVKRLPQPQGDQPQGGESSDDTISAVLATLYEVIKKNPDFAQSLFIAEGVERLVYISKSNGHFSPKVVKFASSLLHAMWQFKELQPEYRKAGWKESDFVTKTMLAKGGRPSPSSTDNTLHRPRMDQSSTTAGYNDHTLPPINRQPYNPQSMGNSYGSLGSNNMGTPSTGNSMGSPMGNSMGNSMGSSVGHIDDRDYHRSPERGPYDPYRDERLRPEDIPMNNLSAAPVGSPGYASIDPNRRNRDREDYRPPGGVPLFPNLPPGQQQPQPQVDSREPLYAQVDKRNKKRQDGMQHSPHGRMMLEGGPNDEGADSWV